jgi:hypothetical protein
MSEQSPTYYPAHETVLINTLARKLQAEMANTARINADLGKIESLCFEIHKSVCEVIAWVEQERNQK